MLQTTFAISHQKLQTTRLHPTFHQHKRVNWRNDYIFMFYLFNVILFPLFWDKNRSLQSESLKTLQSEKEQQGETLKLWNSTVCLGFFDSRSMTPARLWQLLHICIVTLCVYVVLCVCVCVWLCQYCILPISEPGLTKITEAMEEYFGGLPNAKWFPYITAKSVIMCIRFLL